ncbi:apoptosis-resistant E3 ubiquitin protein ligase 1-like isoform X2 [Ptychodera flava]|uniref:apoptosis-resistant E3 ubiquitin protein ligase 1-like isoform X2 n=1 Tax=Ptychodera flava TaxID=63121 RepID=UPI003969F5E3
MNTFAKGALIFISISCLSSWLRWRARIADDLERQTSKLEIEEWLKDNRLLDFESAFFSTGYKHLEEFAGLNVYSHPSFQDQVSDEAKEAIAIAIQKLEDKVLMREWLEGQGLEKYLQRKQIKDVQEAKNNIDFRNEAWREYVRVTRKPKTGWLWAILSVVMTIYVAPILVFLITCKFFLDNPRRAFHSFLNFLNLRRPHTTVRRTTNTSFLNYITGRFLDHSKCSLKWEKDTTPVVGELLTFYIFCHRKNGTRYRISDSDKLTVKITLQDIKINPTIEIGEQSGAGPHAAKVTFTVHKAGTYWISVMVKDDHIRGSPFDKIVNPGEVSASNTAFLQHNSTIVLTQGEIQELTVEPRDEFGNVCNQKLNNTYNQYDLQVSEIGDSNNVWSSPVWQVTDELRNKILMHIKMSDRGCFRARATYEGHTLKNGDFSIIVLSGSDAAKVKKNVAKKNFNIWYEAYLRGTSNERYRRPRKVYCYLSPRQLTIKEFYLKIIPKRLYTFRVCPSTKFQFNGVNNECGHPMFAIDDGAQPPIDLASKERDLLAATFTQFLLKNIGGSETFQDKQDFFFQEIQQIHSRRSRSKLNLHIKRSDILESSMRATKHFSTSDWCKNFEIEFAGEEGLDWGGVRREWCELVCCALFSTENKLFKRFKDDNQALVHPNPRRPPHLSKMKYYEFAGKMVGKCLYESSMGQGYRQLVKAKFTRSFLAQLIGLRVSYKYFETDDPDTYVTKIKYILENDVEDLDLVFAEEEYNESGQVETVVDLISNGSNIPVTNDNKMQYLDVLAMYKFSKSTEEEIESFLKGLNDFVPDHLLSIFDENELELLMCGGSTFDLDDFKKNCVIVAGGGYDFNRVLGWFWTVVAGFTQDEMARLLQFTTGCSQLPPGGFSELVPKFQISAVPTYGNLPTAHTCFNQLCLPTYDDLEHLKRSLTLAINEGSEGFGMV